jgi:hypothetical protein
MRNFLGALGLVIVLPLLGVSGLAACSASSDTAASPNGDGGSSGKDGGGAADDGATSACTAAPAAEITSPGTVLDVAADAAGAWMLVKTTGNGLAVARPDGTSHVLEASGITTAALATRPDGVVCAAWGLSAGGAHTACGPDFSVVDTKLPSKITGPIAYADDGTNGALLFEGKFASLDSAMRVDGTWTDVDLQESSISYPGLRGLTGATARSSYYCFIADQGSSHAPVIARTLGASGSANTLGTVSLDNASANGCSIVVAGDEIAVVAASSTNAKLASAKKAPGGIPGLLAPLAPESLDLSGTVSVAVVGSAKGFVVVSATTSGVTRAARSAGGTWSSKPVDGLTALPSAHVALALGPDGAEHLVAQSGSKLLYARSCP